MIALRKIDAQLGEALQGRGTLDALGNRGDAQRTSDLADRFDRATVNGVVGQAADELTIDYPGPKTID